MPGDIRKAAATKSSRKATALLSESAAESSAKTGGAAPFIRAMTSAELAHGSSPYRKTNASCARGAASAVNTQSSQRQRMGSSSDLKPTRARGTPAARSEVNEPNEPTAAKPPIR